MNFFNIFQVDLLPSWLAYLLFLESVQLLDKEEKSIHLLKPLLKILIVLSFTTWIYNFLQLNILLIFQIAVNVINLYFHFQFLTNLASIFEKYQFSSTSLLRLRTAQTLYCTLLSLPLHWNVLMGILGLVIVAWISIILKQFQIHLKSLLS